MKLRITVLLTIALSFSLAQANVCVDLFYARSIEPSALQFPQNGRSLVVDISRVSSVPDGKNENVIKVREAAEGASQFIENRDAVRTVLYPSSGFDAAMGFALFPKATTVIGMDQHAFLRGTSSKITAEAQDFSSPRYARYKDVDISALRSGLGTTILGNLVTSFPSIRILSVREYKEPNGDSHGVIDFDTGPGTAAKRYIHIDTIIPNVPVDVGQATYLQRVADIGFDAMVIKGAMFVFLSQNKGGEVLLKKIARDGGIIYDADGMISQTRYEDLGPHVRSSKVETDLGYAPKSNRVWYFPGTNE